MNLEKHIRCKCSKYYGMHNHKKKCKRCKTEVIARGEQTVNLLKNDLVMEVEDG